MNYVAVGEEYVVVIPTTEDGGPDELGGLGAWGQWNVGNWCEDVQRSWLEQNI
jgi:hypothetical protein